MSQLSIYLEIIAAVLAGLDYLVPPKVYDTLDKQLKNLLKHEESNEAPLDRKSLSLSYLIVAAVVLGIMGWGAYQDIHQGNLATLQIARSYIFLFVGVLLGMVALVLFTHLLERLVKSFKRNSVGVMGRSNLAWFVAIALLFAGIFSLAPSPQWLDSLPLGFAFGAIMLDLLLLALAPLQKWLTFDDKIMARLGILIFLSAMIIQLKSS